MANQVTLFLRRMLAFRCRTRLHCTRPAEPRELGALVHNFAPAEGPGRVPLKPDGEVKVVFAEPVRGGLLDFGAAWDGHYEITFHNRAETLGRVYVPRANFPGASIPSLKGAGIHIPPLTI